MLSESEFVRVHREQHIRLLSYLVTGRGRHSVDPQVWENLLERSAGSLKATQPRSRIEFAAAVHRLFETRIAANMDHCYFWTFVPERFGRTWKASLDCDIHDLIAWSREALRGLHYIAAVEAAYYPRLRRAGATNGWVSWHSHALVWGVDEAAMQELRAGINLDHPPFIPGRATAHFRRLSSRAAAGRSFYMLKAPVSEYTAIEKVEERVDGETGEIFKRSTAEFNVKKRPFRTGDLYRAVQVLSHRTLSELTFGNGAGKSLLRLAEQEAKRAIEQQDTKHLRL